jgi:uncharacterized membrane protein
MEPKRFFLIIHVLGVVFGLGGAIMLDIYLLRALRGATIQSKDVSFVEFVARFVQLGMCLLWFSGPALVAIAPEPFAALGNPKLQAKLVIVGMLTLNMIVIETLALPLVRQNRGRRLFDGVSEAGRSVMLVSGAISATSWAVPFILGLSREFNQIVPASHILGVYAGLLALAIIGLQGMGRVLYEPDIVRRAAAALGRPILIRSANVLSHTALHLEGAAHMLTPPLPGTRFLRSAPPRTPSLFGITDADVRRLETLAYDVATARRRRTSIPPQALAAA